MWPEVDETPPRDADIVLPEVLRRGRELRRVQVRRRQAGLLGRAAAVVVVAGMVAAGTRGSGGDEPTRRSEQLAAPTTTEGDAPGTSSSTFPPFTIGTDRAAPGTVPGSTTTVGTAGARSAPVVVLEVRDANGRYRTAVLRPGALAPVPITVATAERQTPVISPDGTRIAYQRLQPHPVTGQQRWELFVVDLDGDEVRQVTGGGLLREGLGLFDGSLGSGSRWPTWSPDGSQLAFTCSGATGLPQVCVAQADGMGRRAITLEGQGFHQPSWSPDGTQIAAKREVAAGVVSLWLLDPAGASLPVALPTPVFDASGATLTWLTSGTLVYARGGDSGTALRTLDVRTGVERAVPTAGPVRFPIACGAQQVLYLRSDRAADGTALRTGALVLTGTDGSIPTIVLPSVEGQERLPSSCATG